MIYGTSPHPVLIKKIQMRVWSVRDEIEAALLEEYRKSGKDLKEVINNYAGYRENSEAIIQGPFAISPLIKQYNQDQNLNKAQSEKKTENDDALTDNDELDTSEDAMMQALAESDTSEEVKDAGELDTSEDEMMKALAGDSKDEDVKNAQELDTSEDEMMKALAGDSEEAGNSEDSATEDNVTPINPNISENQKPNGQNKLKVNRKIPTIKEERIAKASSLLSDINMDRISFFCNKYFCSGQSIVIEFLIPDRFFVNAEVIQSQKYNLKSKVISQNPTEYRTHAFFTFIAEGERTLLRRFVQSIEPDISDIPVVEAAASGSSDESEDDDLDDLDDLDL